MIINLSAIYNDQFVKAKNFNYVFMMLIDDFEIVFCEHGFEDIEERSTIPPIA